MYAKSAIYKSRECTRNGKTILLIIYYKYGKEEIAVVMWIGSAEEGIDGDCGCEKY